MEEILVEDIFGRQLNQTAVVLVDWEGYIANPLLKMYVRPPGNATFPAAARLTANGTRLYFDLPSAVGAGGPSKTLIFTDTSPIPFSFSIFPDRDTLDEAYALTIDFTDSQNRQTSETVAIRVVDQDKEAVGPFHIAVDFSQDQTGLFADPQKRAIVRQVADDWAYFIDDMGLDGVAAGAEQTFIWDPGGFDTGRWIANATAYTGHLHYAYGNRNSELRSGGQPSTHAFHTSGGNPLPLRRSSGIQMHTDGNFNRLGWFLTAGDEDWWVSGNLGDEPNDFYSIAHHEMGHALFFNPGYPNFEKAKSAGEIADPAVSAYHRDNPPIDQFDHFPAAVDRASQRGAFGNEYFGAVPQRRWLITKLDLLIAQSIGYNLRETSPFVPLSLANSSLPLGEAGQAYAVALQATGGIPFYRWTIDSGALPAGLALDSFTGCITGQPTETGTFDFAVRVREYDESAAGVSVALRMTVVEEMRKVFLPLVWGEGGSNFVNLCAQG